MPNTPNQDISDDVPALPYEVFEIRTIAVIGGVKLPVAYVSVVEGEIKQAIAELQIDDSSWDIALRHCLRAASSYSVRSMGWAPDMQGAEYLWRQLIAEHPLVLNQPNASDGGNSIHRQYLREHALEVKNSESETRRCASCGVNKVLKEFNKIKGVLRDDCKLCLDEANIRDLKPAQHREYRINGWVLPPRKSPPKEKRCFCCGQVKKREDFGFNKRTPYNFLNPSCNDCLSEKNSRRISMKALRDEKQGLGPEGRTS